MTEKVRHCSAESVEVYEAVAPTLQEALRNVADFVEADGEDGWFNLSLGMDPDNADPIVLLYRHA